MEKHYNLLEVANGKPIKLWTQGVPVEDDARKQLINTAKMPFIFKHLAVMPDVHLGEVDHRQRDPHRRRHHPGRRGCGHRLRDDRRTHLADGFRPAG